MNIISIILDAPQESIARLANKLAGVKVSTVYAQKELDKSSS